MHAKENFQKSTAYFIFFLAASFYLYEFILQVAPSVMAESMMKAFGVNHSWLLVQKEIALKPMKWQIKLTNPTTFNELNVVLLL